MSVDLLIHVQHLLGIGHLTRTARLARALGRQGLELVFVSGGLPVPGLDVGRARFEQLTPVRAGDAAFSFLADAEGAPLSEAVKAARRDRLLALVRAARPKAVMTEMFPFGRRALRFELLPLLEAVRRSAPSVKVVCSLRDVLNQPLPAAKADWMVATVNRWYDLVLVHGDPAFLPLTRSFPRAAELACPLVYTGYVAPEPAGAAAPARREEVLVSAGGGAVGLPLLRSALAARPLSRLAHLPWRVLAGPGLSERDLGGLAAAAPPGILVERPRAALRALLAAARVSVSQGGYNTVVEVLQSGVPAVVVPFAAPGESEQSERAAALAARGLVTHLPAARLSPEALAAAIDAAARPEDLGLDFAGAGRSAEIIAQLIARQVQ